MLMSMKSTIMLSISWNQLNNKDLTTVSMIGVIECKSVSMQKKVISSSKSSTQGK